MAEESKPLIPQHHQHPDHALPTKETDNYNAISFDEDTCSPNAPPSRISSLFSSLKRRAVLFVAFILLFAPFSYYFISLTAAIEPTSIKVPDLIRVQELHPSHHPHSNKRLVIVGDVHGRLDALQHLLKKVKFNEHHDHLVLLGDMITKGDDSVGVLDYAMSINASCVRGNHEDNVLREYAHHYKLPEPKVEPIKDIKFSDEAQDSEGVSQDADEDAAAPDTLTAAPVEDDADDQLQVEKRSNSDAPKPNLMAPMKVKDQDVALLLKPRHVSYLGSCPAILYLGSSTGFHSTPAVAVHAGLQWHIPKLTHQHPSTVFTMRSLLPSAFTRASEDREGVTWSKIWTDKQTEKSRHKDRMTVFYGHDAKNGLTLRKYSAGLDTGCVGGGKLTAMVVSKKNGIVKHKLESVGC